MRYFLLALAAVNLSITCFAQKNNEKLRTPFREQFQETAAPNIYDSLYQLSLQELSLPDHLRNAALPAVVDNSTLPYLRPVFAQVGASCGQASSVGYNFTYEIDLARNLPADTSINQYPTHFTYNFENGGYEYFGVSYLHSFEVLRKCGCMNVQDYGGLTDGGGRWITGYDLYYKAMQNRVEDVYTIKTNTSKGILTLKNWVYNHMGESTKGGVASFYSGSPWNSKLLPPGTPEAGKSVMTEFTVPASHAMTIVGYNDSIRYDYNNDGKYTNTIDINNDGIIDVRDWEIGGFKLVNSYGSTATDNGFCYMMYRTLAEDYNHGGIWNTSVHVVKVKPVYSPLLTMKIRLEHTKRSALHIRAGVSTDTSVNSPDHVMDFPVFNFQGGNFPMQGPGESDTLKTIEFGLDITPLLSYVQNNKQSSFFLMVEENDPASLGNGSIKYFSVIDYSGASPIETNCLQAPLSIENNDVTLAKVILTPNANKVKIQDPTLPAFTPGQPLTIQMSATGGQPPYNWYIRNGYTQLKSNQPMSPFEGIRVLPQYASDSVMPVDLGFEFPFYGKKYDTVYVNMNNGYLQFTPDKIPWPYLSEMELLLQSYRVISPLTNLNFNSTLMDEGAWYEKEAGTVKFRWMLRKRIGETYFPYEFQVKLSADGTITFNHNHLSVVAPDQFFSGISDGDRQSFDLTTYNSDYDANLFNQIKYIPSASPDNLKISKAGLLECIPSSSQQVYEVDCRVTDYRNIFDEINLKLTTGIIPALQIHAGIDSVMDAGEEVLADLVLTNVTGTTFNNITSTLSIADPFITITDSSETTSTLGAFSKIVIPGAYHYKLAEGMPDEHKLLLEIVTKSNLLSWKSSLPASIHSSRLRSVELKSTKPGNQMLLPGDLGGLRYVFSNVGHSKATDVSVAISFSNPSVQLLSAGTQVIGEIAAGQKSWFEFQVKISDSILLGTRIPVKVTLSSGNQIVVSDTLFFRIGKMPVLVIDFDIKHESAPVILQQIKDLGYLADYNTMINSEISEYQSVFLSLGKFSDRRVLNYSEGATLTDFLDAGGNLYIESTSFWRDDLITSLQPRFNAETKNKFHKFDTIQGSAGSFAEGMSFLNTGYPISMYYLTPVYTGFSLFNDENYCGAVANDAGIYKTIGTLFEFTQMKGLNDTSGSAMLMQKYLDFFSVKRNSIGIDEHGQPHIPGSFSVYPNPATEKVYFTFGLSAQKAAGINIFDINGIKVADLTDIQLPPDQIHTIEWNLCRSSGQRVTPGIYFCRILTQNQIMLGKILVK